MVRLGVIVAALVLAAGGVWYWFYGPCGTKRVEASVVQLRSQADKWGDAVQLVSRTPRIALAGPVGRLQDIRRETREMVMAPCADHARNLLVRSMDHTIDAVMAFMGSGGSGDAAKETVSELAGNAAERLNDFTTELGHVTQCAPRCDWLVLNPD